MRVVIFGFALVNWGVTIPSVFGQSEDLVTFARVRNKAAIDSIKSMECRYERIPVPPTTLAEAGPPCFHIKPAPGRFWRSGDTFRLVDPINDGTTREYVARDGKLLVWRGGGPLKTPTLALYTIEPIFGVGGEMWEYLLFSHWGGGPPTGKGSYPFYDIAADPTCVVHVAERTTHPLNAIHIDLSHTGGRFECWLDKTNYLIRKLIWILHKNADGSQQHYEHEVIEFREPAPGVYVPVIIEHRCYNDKALRSTIRTIISNLKVNHSLAETDLQIPGIAGMKCIDDDREVEFAVDAGGERVGPESPTKRIQLALDQTVVGWSGQYDPLKIFKMAPDEAEDGWRGDPSERSGPLAWWAWCLLASVGVLLVGVLVRVRRAKSRRQGGRG